MLLYEPFFLSIDKFKIVLVYQRHICISQSSHFYTCWWTQNVDRWALLCFVSPYASSLGWFCNRAALVHPAVADVELGENECAYWLLVFVARLICVYHMCNDDQNWKLILHNGHMCQMSTELGLECVTILYIQHFNTYWCCHFSHLDWLISQCIPRTIFNE